MTQQDDRNWNITFTGSISVLLLSALYLFYAVTSVELLDSILLATGSGIVYSIGTVLKGKEKFQSLTEPLSGFLAMISGVMIVAATVVFFASSTEVLTGLFSQGLNLLQLIRTIITSFIGLAGFLLGSYFIGTGSSMIFFDRLDSKASIGPGKSDLIFPMMLGGFTFASLTGTAFIKEVSITEYYSQLTEIIISSEPLAGTVTGLLMFFTYIFASNAWSSMPISESIPSSSLETYRKLARIDTVFKWLIIPVLSVSTAVNDFVQIKQLARLDLLTQPALRSLFLTLLTLSIMIIIGVKLLQTFTGDKSRIYALGPYIVFGLTAWLIAPQLAVLIDTVISFLPEALRGTVQGFQDSFSPRNTGMILLTVASGVSFALKSFMGLIRGLGIIPAGLEGTTLSATGVFISSVGVFMFQPSTSSSLLFVGVALSVVLWEIGKRSTVLGREVGRNASTTQAEIVQLIMKLVLAFITVIIARTVLVFVQRTGLTVPQGAQSIPVFLIVVSGIILLIFSLKEYT